MRWQHSNVGRDPRFDTEAVYKKHVFFSERLKDLKVYQIRIRYENVLVWYIFFRLLKCWSGLPGPPQSFFCLIHLTCPHVSYHQLLSRFASRYMVQGLLPDGPGFWSRLREHQGCWRWEPSAMRFEAFIGTWAVLNPCWLLIIGEYIEGASALVPPTPLIWGVLYRDRWIDR